MNYCVIGDVHGEYDALLDLVAKTPRGSQLIFVGDLIDRGEKSANVVRFIRKHKLPCVQGNHEFMMIDYGSKFIEDVRSKNPISQNNMWLNHGGKETLLSYGLISIENNKIIPHPFIQDFIFQFEDDIAWMKGLPLYLELNVKHASGRDVVVSHSSLSSVWDFKNSLDLEDLKRFKNTVLWGRREPFDNEKIFNIFGHTPQQYSADVGKHYVNIDTGCYKKEEAGFGLLSAYSIETEEIYSSSSLFYAKVS